MNNVAAINSKAPIRVHASRLSLAASGLFLVLLALLHLIKPELDPSWRMVSEYAIGPFGWIMAAAFLSMSISCAVLFAAIRTHINTTGGQIGLVLLLVSSVAMAAAAVFTADPMTASKEELTLHGNFHGISAMFGIPGMTLAAVLVSRGLVRNPSWHAARRPVLWSARLVWISIVSMVLIVAVALPQNGGSFGPDVWIGWPNRLAMIGFSLWLMAVARHAARLRS